MEAAGGKSQRKFGGVTRCGTQSREATSPTLSGNGRQVPDGVNGREAASRQIFLHVEGPDGLIFSYVNGMAELDDKPRLARQFPLVPSSLCDWGSESKDVPELSAPG